MLPESVQHQNSKWRWVMTLLVLASTTVITQQKQAQFCDQNDMSWVRFRIKNQFQMMPQNFLKPAAAFRQKRTWHGRGRKKWTPIFVLKSGPTPHIHPPSGYPQPYWVWTLGLLDTSQDFRSFSLFRTQWSKHLRVTQLRSNRKIQT